MTVNYFDEEIKNAESFKSDGPFLGYISPSGKLIDYTYLIGERGHGNWRNPVTPLFVTYMSYVNLGDNIVKYKDSDKKWYKDLYEKNKYEGLSDSVLRGPTYAGYNEWDYEKFIINLNNRINEIKKQTHYMNEWDCLKLDLMLFFEKCYSKRDFFNSFGNVVKVPCFELFLEMHGKDLKWLGHTSYSAQEDQYREYVIATLMHSAFKDVLVQYLGYDSIERAIPDNRPYYLSKNLYHASYGFKYSNYPSILTSCSNPNERFYNWKLMNYEIKQVDRMLWNEEEKRYIKSPIRGYHQSDKELLLGKEIEAIKREVPLQKRKEYFR